METKKPKVKLVGTDGNVFCLLSKCTTALKKAGYEKERINEFQNEVTSSSSYDEALCTMTKWLEVH